MVLSTTVFKNKPSNKNTRSTNNVATQTHNQLNSTALTAPISIPHTPDEVIPHHDKPNSVKKVPATPTNKFLYTLLSSSPVVDGLEMSKTPENKCNENSKTQKKDTRKTRYTSQGPWTSQPMPKISEETKKPNLQTPPKKRSFIMKQLLKIKRFFSKPHQPLHLDGPYVNPVIGCSCGKCEQEFYINKYVAYGINLYSNKPCVIIPAHCQDFAVIFYC